MSQKKNGNLLAFRPHKIVEARFKLNKRQNDMIDIILHTIKNEDKNNAEKLEYEINVSQYAELYEMKDKSNLYSEFKKATKSLESASGFRLDKKDIEYINKFIEDEEKQFTVGDDDSIFFNWVSSIQYHSKFGKIEIELGKKFKKVLVALRDANNAQKLYYNIKYPLNFSSVYSKRMYYYLKVYDDTEWRVDNLNELREKLECPVSYKRFSTFKKNVLDPAFTEINNHSDISFNYKVIYDGKKKNIATHLRFKIKLKKQTSKQLSNQRNISTTKQGINEVAATETSNKLKNVALVKIIYTEMFEGELTDNQAKTYLKVANNNIDFIKEQFKVVQQSNCDSNLNGLIYRALEKKYQKNTKYTNNKGTGDSFSNRNQRKYPNLSEIERTMLGWDNCYDENGEIKEEYLSVDDENITGQAQ